MRKNAPWGSFIVLEKQLTQMLRFKVKITRNKTRNSSENVANIVFATLKDSLQSLVRMTQKRNQVLTTRQFRSLSQLEILQDLE